MAGSDYILKIDGIEGESEQKGHVKQIEIESWGFGVSNQGTSAIGGGAASGKGVLQDFHFSLPIGKAGPNLMKHCFGGKHIGEATLYCRKSTGAGGQQEYATFTFTDVFLSHWGVDGHNGGGLPSEQISFNFTKVKYEYKPQKKDGTLDSAITGEANVKEGTHA